MRQISLRAWFSMVVTAAPLLAQPFDSAYHVGDPGNDLAGAVRINSGGFAAAGTFSGVGSLVKLAADGSIVWAHSYGTVKPAAVRPGRGDDLAWIGNVPDPHHPVPIFVLCDGSGAVRRALSFTVPNTLSAEVTTLDVEPAGGGFWVGGNATYSGDLQEVWLAHLDADANVLFLGAFQPPLLVPSDASIRIDSLIRTPSSGTLAVGRFVSTDVGFLGKRRMYALAVDASGKLLWSHIYFQELAATGAEQWFVGVARDPLSSSTAAYALAHGDHQCGIDRRPNLPCIDLFTGGILAVIDQVTGNVNNFASVFISAPTHTVLYNPTSIARDESNDVIAVGGSIDPGGTNREASLVRLRQGPAPSNFTLLGAESYGDGAGPFVSEVADLELLRQPSAPIMVPGWLLANHESMPGVARPTIVTTDLTGLSDGSCESSQTVVTAPSLVASSDLSLTPVSASSATYPLVPADLPLTREPCLVLGAERKGKPGLTN